MVAEANNNEIRNRERPHDQPDIPTEHTVEIPYQEGSIIISFSPEWGRSNLPLQNVFGTQGANRLGLPPSVTLSNKKGINPMAQQMLNRPELHAGVDAHEEFGQRDYRLRALSNAGISVSQTEDATYIHISRIPPNQWVQINGQKYYGPIGNGYGTETNIPIRGMPVRNETGRQTGEQNSEGRDIRLVQENGPEGFFASVESNVSSRSQAAEETAQRHVRVLGGAPGQGPRQAVPTQGMPGRLEQGQFVGQGMPPQMEGGSGFERRIARLEPVLVQEIKQLPAEYQDRTTLLAEQINVSERAILVVLLQKIRANIMILSQTVTLDGRLRQANEPGLPQNVSLFLASLSVQERALFERISRISIAQGGRIEFRRIAPESYPLEKDSPDVQQKIEKSLKRYHEAKTEEDKLIAEGILRMQGVDVEASNLSDIKKVKMHPKEGMQRIVGLIIGLIQVCVGVNRKAEGKKTEIETGPGIPGTPVKPEKPPVQPSSAEKPKPLPPNPVETPKPLPPKPVEAPPVTPPKPTEAPKPQEIVEQNPNTPRIVETNESREWSKKILGYATNSKEGGQAGGVVDTSHWLSPEFDSWLERRVGQKQNMQLNGRQGSIELGQTSENDYKYSFIVRDTSGQIVDQWYVSEARWYKDQFGSVTPDGSQMYDHSSRLSPRPGITNFLAIWKRGPDGQVDKQTQCLWETGKITTGQGNTRAFDFGKIAGMMLNAQEMRKLEQQNADEAKKIDFAGHPVGYVSIHADENDVLAKAHAEEGENLPRTLNGLKDKDGKPRYNFVSLPGESVSTGVDGKKNSPATVLQQKVDALYQNGLRHFFLNFGTHGDPRGLSFNNVFLTPEQIISVLDAHSDCDFYLNTGACYTGGMATKMQQYIGQRSDRPGRIVMRFSTKQHTVGTEGRVEGEFEGTGDRRANKITTDYYTIFLTKILAEHPEMTFGEAHLKADLEAKKYVPMDSEMWISKPNAPGTHIAEDKPNSGTLSVPV